MSSEGQGEGSGAEEMEGGGGGEEEICAQGGRLTVQKRAQRVGKERRMSRRTSTKRISLFSPCTQTSRVLQFSSQARCSACSSISGSALTTGSGRGVSIASERAVASTGTEAEGRDVSRAVGSSGSAGGGSTRTSEAGSGSLLFVEGDGLGEEGVMRSMRPDPVYQREEAFFPSVLDAPLSSIAAAAVGREVDLNLLPEGTADGGDDAPDDFPPHPERPMLIPPIPIVPIPSQSCLWVEDEEVEGLEASNVGSE